MDKPGDATDVLEAVQADPEEVRAAVPQVEAARLAYAADTTAADTTPDDTAAADTTTADTATADTAPAPEAGLPPEVTLAAEAPPGEPAPQGPGAPLDLRLTEERPAVPSTWPCAPAHRGSATTTSPPGNLLLQYHRAARFRCRPRR